MVAPPRTELGFRTVTCAFFVIALVYFVLAVTRSFDYGTRRSSRWQRYIEGVVAEMHERLNVVDISKEAIVIGEGVG